MIMELFEQGITNQVALVFGCPYRTDIIYPKYLHEMEAKHKNFHYIKMISREDRRSDGTKYYVQTAIDDHADILSPILGAENTLIYLCGMKGMETGIYQNLAKHGFFSYLTLKGDLAERDPSTWSWEEAKKMIKPSVRTFEEVY